jgi:TPR repeat protein
MAYDVFISYASEDKIVADAVCAKLEANAVRCWIAPRDVVPGMAYGEAIIDAIRGCRVMVLVFSSKSNSSPHIPKEIERAVSAGVSVIPFRIEEVRPGKSLDYFIGSVHWLDALTQPLEQHLQRLAQNVQTLLSRDAVVIDPKPSATAAPMSSVASIPVPPVAPGSGRSPWLYVALGSMAVLAIVFAVLLFARKPSRTAQVAPAAVAPSPASAAPATAAPAAAAPIAVAPVGSTTPAVSSTPTGISSPDGSAAATPPQKENKAGAKAASVPAQPKPSASVPATPSTAAEGLFDQGNAAYKGRQFSQAAQLFQKACDGGERKGCNTLGLMYYNGEGLPKDLNRAKDLYKRACDAGGSGGCLNLGLLYFRGEDLPKDLDRAAALFKRACDAGGAPGCNNLGLMYHDGEGVAKDLSRAADLYKRACDAGGSAGCTNLGAMYVRGENVPQDPVRAADLFKRGCDQGNAAGCNHLGLLYEHGRGVANDSNRAADLFKKACDEGNDLGCRNLSRLKK